MVSQILLEKGIDLRVVSMPSIERFADQSRDYQESVLPPKVRRFVLEASSSYSWYSFVDSKEDLFTIDSFGYSGKKEDVLAKFHFVKEEIAERIEELLK